MDSESINTLFPVIVFDIGGTWFRSGLFSSDNKLSLVSKSKAINYKNTLHKKVVDLQEALVDYILDKVKDIQKKRPNLDVNVVSISMGAALNAHNGLILNSGPLWGPECMPFNLLSSLKKRNSIIRWNIVNDISASLLRNVSFDNEKNLKTSLITISTGVGARTFNHSTKSIPVDPTYGIQGEIGHIPINFIFRDTLISSVCDCGGLNHLNAFCSGRGIESLIPKIANLYPSDYKKSKLFNNKDKVGVSFSNFLVAIKSNDNFAYEILHSVTKPIADFIVNLFTVDPLTNKVILTGGVAHSLGDVYVSSLLKNLNKIGMYQITNKDSNFFKKKIVLGKDDDNSGLVGAAIHSRINCKSKGRYKLSTNQLIAFDVFTKINIFGEKQAFNVFAYSHSNQKSNRRIVFIDENVNNIYGKKLELFARNHGNKVTIVPIKTSESLKNKNTLFKVIDHLKEFNLNRKNEPIIVVGGGSLMDVVGLAANLHKRGTPYIKIPTTLIGIVDAGIGVKTAINYEAGKNRIGSYYAPIAVFNDVRFLKSLPTRHIRNGLAEIVKIALIKDNRLFYLLKKHSNELITTKFQQGDVAEKVINRAIIGMLEELEPNLWENNLERIVDFGHTISPFIEMVDKSNIHHGEAVSIDMSIFSTLSYYRKLISKKSLKEILNLLIEIRLPIYHESCEERLLTKSLKEVTAHRNGKQRMPIITSIGSTKFVNNIKTNELLSSVEFLKKYSK